MYAVSAEGCEAVIEEYDLRTPEALDVYLDVWPSCLEGGNGEIHFDIWAEGDEVTVFIEDEEVSLELNDAGAYIGELTGLLPGVYTGYVSSGECERSLTINVEGVTPSDAPLNVYVPADEIVICAGEPYATASIRVVGGLSPVGITWSDGLSQDQSRRRFYSPGTYIASVSDRCGFTRTATIEVKLPQDANPLEVRYATADGTCTGQGEIALVDESGPRWDRPSFGLDANDLSKTSFKVMPGDYTVYVRYTNDECVSEQTMQVGNTRADITTAESCGEADNGRIEIRLVDPPAGTPSVSIDGSPMSVSSQGGLHYVSSSGIAADSDHAVQIDYGACVSEQSVFVGDEGLQKSFTSYNEDTGLCTFDFACQEQPIPSMAQEVPVVELPDAGHSPCRALMVCDGHVADRKRISKKTVRVWKWQTALNTTLSSGIHLPGYYPGARNYDLENLKSCDRVTYCPANMEILMRYDFPLARDGSSPNNRPNSDCAYWNCSGIRSIFCYDPEMMPAGVSRQLFDNEISRPPCAYARISLKQLLVWHDDLRRTRDDYVVGDSQGDRLLRDVAERLFRELGPTAAQLPSATTSPDAASGWDPLMCAHVEFCINDLRVLTVDDWRSIDCGSHLEGGAFDTRCRIGVAGSDFDDCSEDPSRPTSVSAICPNDGRTQPYVYDFDYRVAPPTVNTRQYFCFPAENFEQRVAPGDSKDFEVVDFEIAPYVVPSKLKSFVPIIVQQEGVGAHDPKLLNHFGDVTSYSEQLNSDDVQGHKLVSNTISSVEVIADEDNAFSMTLAGRRAGQIFLGKTDDTRVVSFPSTVSVNDWATDVDATHLVVHSEEPFDLVGEEWTQRVPSGDYVATLDYADQIQLNALTPLGGALLVFDSEAYSYSRKGSSRRLVSNGDRTALLDHNRSSGRVSVSRLSPEGLEATVRFALPALADTVLLSPLLPALVSYVAYDFASSSVRVSAALPERTKPLSVLDFGVTQLSDITLSDISANSDAPTYLIHNASSVTKDSSEPIALVPSTMYLISLHRGELVVEAIQDYGDAELDAIYTQRADRISVALQLPGASRLDLTGRAVVNNSPHRQVYRHDIPLDRSPSNGLELFEDRELSVSVYPNPANSTLRISLSIPTDSPRIPLNGYLSVYSASGALMSKLPADNLFAGGNAFNLDVSQYAVGSYYLTLQYDGHTLAARPFIVAR